MLLVLSISLGGVVRAETAPAPMRVGYPGTAEVPPGGGIEFLFPLECPGPCPAPRGLTLTNQGQHSAAASYDGKTLTLTAPPGDAVNFDAGCDPSPAASATIRCAEPAPPFGLLSVTFDVVPVPADAPPQTVTYAAGWNLIGMPDGTVLTDTGAPILAYDPASNAYQMVPAGGPLRGGTGYWVYFDSPVTQVLPAVGPINAEIPLPRGRYILIGNPGQAPVMLSPVDSAWTYDPENGSYQSPPLLQPGQGIWVYSAAGGTVRLSSGLP